MQTYINAKKLRPTEREMTTPLFLLRCVQLGLSLRDLDLVTIGMVNDMYADRFKKKRNEIAGSSTVSFLTDV